MLYGKWLMRIAMVSFPPLMLFLFWYSSCESIETRYPKLKRAAQLFSGTCILVFMWVGIFETLMRGGE